MKFQRQWTLDTEYKLYLLSLSEILSLYICQILSENVNTGARALYWDRCGPDKQNIVGRAETDRAETGHCTS